jgi:hypothetical protein
LAIRRRRAGAVFLSGVLLNVVCSVAVLAWGPGTLTSFVQVNALGLAVGSLVWTLVALVGRVEVPCAVLGGRRLVFAHLAAQLAVVLLGLVAANAVLHKLLDLTPHPIGPLDWSALVAAIGAVAICFWDPTARFPLAGLYALGLITLGMELVFREFSPAGFFLWAGLCEFTGYVLATAVLGWSLPRGRMAASWLRIPDDGQRWSREWLSRGQAVLVTAAGLVAGWISIDFFFDGMGEGRALFDLTGRRAGCPAALMLVGATILMAWQTRDPWRARWQFAALATGLLFTSSLGWSGIDSSEGTLVVWLDRSATLLICACMMTFMTGLGLARVLPRDSDWIPRARQAMPTFAGLTVLMLVVVLLQKAMLSLGSAGG